MLHVSLYQQFVELFVVHADRCSPGGQNVTGRFITEFAFLNALYPVDFFRSRK